MTMCGSVYSMLFSPSPHGEGGLKWDNSRSVGCSRQSLPTRGGWIEILDGKESHDD